MGVARVATPHALPRQCRRAGAEPAPAQSPDTGPPSPPRGAARTLEASSLGKDRILPLYFLVRFFGRNARDPWRGHSNLRCDMLVRGGDGREDFLWKGGVREEREA